MTAHAVTSISDSVMGLPPVPLTVLPRVFKCGRVPNAGRLNTRCSSQPVDVGYGCLHFRFAGRQNDDQKSRRALQPQTQQIAGPSCNGSCSHV
jgi:hypothetical protein